MKLLSTYCCDHATSHYFYLILLIFKKKLDLFYYYFYFLILFIYLFFYFFIFFYYFFYFIFIFLFFLFFYYYFLSFLGVGGGGALLVMYRVFSLTRFGRLIETRNMFLVVSFFLFKTVLLAVCVRFNTKSVCECGISCSILMAVALIYNFK